MKKSVLSVLAIVLACAPSFANAAPPRTASADFGSLNGCVDETFGVTATATEASYWFASTDNCEFGSSWSFAGTVPLEHGDFRTKGGHEATLVKTFASDGGEVAIALTWEAQDEGSVAVTGSFVVNGLDRISGGTFASASLTNTRP